MKFLARLIFCSSVAQASLRFPPGFYSATDSEVHFDGDFPANEARDEPSSSKSCRYLPGDKQYPTDKEWSALNKTVNGRLIRGSPLGKICYGNGVNANVCAELKNEWSTVDPYLNDPVNVMSPFWQDNACSPFQGPTGACELGNLAPYAIDVGDASHVIAGLKFAEKHNIRLTIKNTGHDHLGRSSGAGSLALWTHNLKSVDFVDYKSSWYTGPAARLGAGIQVKEAYQAAQAKGLQVTAGGCPTVGLAGWLPGAGHGPLTSAYGLGADNALEYDVVTAAGRRLTASPRENSDLFWALSGGGAGNYAVVMSVTVRAYPDGPVSGANLLFTNTNPEAYWGAVAAWLRTLLVLDADFPSLRTAVTFTGQFFYLDWATLPDDAKGETLAKALAPFRRELERLNITLLQDDTQVKPDFVSHYEYFSGFRPWGTNQTLGNRLIPRSLVRDKLPDFVGTIRSISEATPQAVFVFAAANAKRAGEGKGKDKRPDVAVLPAWRESLLLLNFGLEMSPDAADDEIRLHQSVVNGWQDTFRRLTPASGGYLNEGTFDNAEWKTDYFGANYNRLLAAKKRYDPGHLLWARAAVGSDLVWAEGQDGRLCRRR